MVESVSTVWWVTERNRGGLKGKANRGPRKELEGSEFTPRGKVHREWR